MRSVHIVYWSLATFLFTIIYNHTEIEIQTYEPETTDVNEGTKKSILIFSLFN